MNYKIATIGMFDGLHRGHRDLLRQLRVVAAERHLEPMVVTFADHPLRLIAPERAPQLLSTADEKVAMLHHEGIADVLVLPFDDALRHTSTLGFMQRLYELGVRVLLLGFNNRFGHDAPREFDDYRRLGREVGIEVLQAAPYEPQGQKISSSRIRQLLADGDVATAAELLGHPYELRGTIVHGRQLGRTIGFPTANLQPFDARRLVPGDGVYCARVFLADGTDHPAMVNVGHRPTVEAISADAPRSIEIHVIDFTGDLYATPVTLRFLRRLRSERRFPTLEALRLQLLADRRACQGRGS